jgi:hypothetical protein
MTKHLWLVRFGGRTERFLREKKPLQLMKAANGFSWQKTSEASRASVAGLLAVERLDRIVLLGRHMTDRGCRPFRAPLVGYMVCAAQGVALGW